MRLSTLTKVLCTFKLSNLDELLGLDQKGNKNKWRANKVAKHYCQTGSAKMPILVKSLTAHISVTFSSECSIVFRTYWKKLSKQNSFVISAFHWMLQKRGGYWLLFFRCAPTVSSRNMCQWIGDGIQLQPRVPKIIFFLTQHCWCYLLLLTFFWSFLSPFHHFCLVDAASNALTETFHDLGCDKTKLRNT